MKRFTLMFFVLWAISIFAIGITPADYYLPLQVGNQLVYRSGDEESTWEPRTGYETIEGIDSLFGHIYYKQVGSSFMDSNPHNEHISHVFWLREDSLRNILIAAVGLGGSRELDSAMIYPQEYVMFFCERFEPGYSLHYDYEGLHMLDSTISNSESVYTGAGTFNNCIKTMEYRTDSSGNKVWEQYTYFAENVGEIKKDRIYPDPHTTLLQQINFQTNIEKMIPNECSLGQNCPNPFNPLTTIEYQVPSESYIEIGVYDITGKQVASLINTNRKAGYHKVIWNVMDLVSGIYIYTLRIDNMVVDRKKMIILK